jgi:hypothetical protein
MRKMKMPVAAIAAALGVTERTTWNWRREHKAFYRKMKANKASPFRRTFQGQRLN